VTFDVSGAERGRHGGAACGARGRRAREPHGGPHVGQGAAIPVAVVHFQRMHPFPQQVHPDVHEGRSDHAR
jgi:hypothetical protein